MDSLQNAVSIHFLLFSVRVYIQRGARGGSQLPESSSSSEITMGVDCAFGTLVLAVVWGGMKVFSLFTGVWFPLVIDGESADVFEASPSFTLAVGGLERIDADSDDCPNDDPTPFCVRPSRFDPPAPPIGDGTFSLVALYAASRPKEGVSRPDIPVLDLRVGFEGVPFNVD